jgi:superfamily I DNA/RNA helicase
VILYRINSLSSLFEESMMRGRMPYTIVGDVGVCQRAATPYARPSANCSHNLHAGGMRSLYQKLGLWTNLKNILL